MEDVKRFEFQYGIILLRTKRFQSVMDKLGSNRISKPIGWVLLYIMPVAAALGLFIFLTQTTIFFSPVRSVVATNVRGVTPLAYLGLPGINPYLPWVYGWIALVVAMVIHEGAHGVIARSLGLPVKSSGLLLFLVIPIGAFVDVDEEALKVAKARDYGRVLAAGAGVNFVLGTLCLLILFSVVGAMAPGAHGIGVATVNRPSPAFSAGIRPGDFVVAVNGTSYDDPSQFMNSTWYHPSQNVSVTISRQGRLEVIHLEIGARPDITVACQGPAPQDGSFLCTATLTNFLGSMKGANMTFSSTGSGKFNPANSTCFVRGDSCSITYTPSAGQGASQNVTASYRGNQENYPSLGTVQLTKAATGASSTTNNRNKTQSLSGLLGYFGTTSASYSSLKSLVSTYTGSLFARPILYLCIPTFPQCAGQVPFSNSNAVLYTSPYGDALVPLASLLYWLFFLNFNLSVFNALPLYPLDGGQAFRLGVQALGRGRLSERTLSRISVAVALLVVAVIFSFPAAAYLGLI